MQKVSEGREEETLTFSKKMFLQKYVVNRFVLPFLLVKTSLMMYKKKPRMLLILLSRLDDDNDDDDDYDERYPQESPKISLSARCPQDVIERIVEKLFAFNS